MSDIIEKYGLTAVPRSLDKLVATQSTKKPSNPVSVDEIGFPESTLTLDIRAYAQHHLPRQTYNHSMRVYYYGKLLHQHLQLM